ncbi:unnamed protein product [Parajaminaea phylloscopi]
MLPSSRISASLLLDDCNTGWSPLNTMAAPLISSSARSSAASRVRAASVVASASCPSSSRLFNTTTPCSAGPRANRAPENFDLDKTPKFGYDDVPTIGHLAFNRRRELLHYARVVTHNFPQLEQYRKPYQPPSKENILRFRTMHYQGVAHPAARKSVLVASIKDIFAASPAISKLSGDKAAKAKRQFLHIAGPRWDPGHGVLAEPLRLDGDYTKNVPDCGTLKISCERFPTEKQNMKWCSDVLDEMIVQATQSTEDSEVWKMPLDTRHRVVKDLKKASGGRRRRATIQDWPSHWKIEPVTSSSS